MGGVINQSPGSQGEAAADRLGKKCSESKFVTNWIADGAPDAKLPRFCTEFRPESNGTSSGPVMDPKIKKMSNFFIAFSSNPR